MMDFRSMFSHPATMRLGWTLLHFLWQGAAIAALLGIGLLVMRRARANTRYMVACAALLLMVGAPVLTYAHLTPHAATPLPALAEVPELPETAPSETMAVSTPVTDASFTPVPMEPTPLPPAPAPQPWHARAMGWMEAHLNWIVGVWFCGVLVLSIRLLMGWLGVKRMRSSGAAASETIQKRLKRLAHKLRVTRSVRLLESAATATPVVMGWLRPAILFPASLLTQLSAEQLDAVLAHELAHVRRHDYLVNLLQAVVETLLFYHPAVHWVSRRIRVEREHACDDLAVSACGDSTTYAHALARLAEMNVATPRLVPGASGHLFARIKRLLQVDTPRDNRASVWVGGAVLLTALLICAVTLRASKASGDNADDPVAQEHEAETPPDYSAMFEMIGEDEGMRMPTPEEIEKLGSLWPTVPPEENAVYWFAKANKDLIESCKQAPEPPGSLATESPYAGDAAGFVQYVENNKGVLTTLLNGMSPGRVYALPYLIAKEAGTPVSTLTLLADIRNMGRFVCDTGFAAELQGTPDTAAERYIECMAMGKRIRPTSSTITRLVGIAVQSVGVRSLNSLIANASLSEPVLRRTIAFSHDAETTSEERLSALHREAEFVKVIMAMSPEHARAFGKDHDAYVALMEKEFAKPLPDLLRSAESVASEVKEKYPLHDQAALSLTSLAAKWARADLDMRVLQIRAAIGLYEMKHNGVPPQKLEELTPEYLPKESLIDPFSGSNLKYVRTISHPHNWRFPTSADMGWKLWSVGYDLKDDGGEAADVDQKAWIGPDFVHTNKVRSNIDRRSGGKIKTLPTSKPAEQTPSAKLQFRLVDDSADKRGDPMKDPKNGETVYLLPEILMTEADILSASLQKRERDDKSDILFRLTPDGCRKFADITEKNIGRRLAVVYEGEVVSAPRIMTKISGPMGLITGSDPKELERIAELINAQKRKPASAADEPKAKNISTAITRDIRFTSQTPTKGGGICKWEVPPGAPVRLLTAWYVLKDGKWAAYGGPGGRQVADQSYGMDVEWEWAVEGDMLIVVRGLARLEDDSTNTSRVTAKKAVLIDATLKSETLTEPTVLSNEPTILWRGDWTRDGAAIESVAFVAYAVGDGVEPKRLTDSASDESPSFGPVIKRHLLDNDKREDFFLDLDTGTLFTPPNSDYTIQRNKDWARTRKIDVAVASDGKGLSGLDATFVPVANSQWDKLGATIITTTGGFLHRPDKNGAGVRIPTMDMSVTGITGAKNGGPATYLFKTRERGFGLLQIMGVTGNPKGVKIRYKMMEQTQATARAAVCASNLIQISRVLRNQHRNNHNNWATSLGDLVPIFLDDPKILICPNDAAPMMIKNGLLCSYRYIGNVPMPNSVGQHFFVAYGHTQHYGGRLVLHRNGNVSHVAEENFRRTLTELHEHLKPIMAKPDFPGDRERVNAFCEDRDLLLDEQ